jgi:hypothetical protein
MIFQSAADDDHNQKKIRLVLVGFISILALIFLVYTKSTAPSRHDFDGVYHNDCCGDVIINDGNVHRDGKTVSIKIRRMKFGITGYVNGRFTNTSVFKSDEETAISFYKDGARWELTLPIDRREYVFKSSSGGIKPGSELR